MVSFVVEIGGQAGIGVGDGVGDMVVVRAVDDTELTAG